MVSAAFIEMGVSTTLATGALGIIFASWLVRWPRIALGGLLLTIVLGQAVRWPLPGQGGGVLPSDLAVGLILVGALGRFIYNRGNNQAAWRMALLFMPFIGWSLFTLLLRIGDLGWRDLAVSGAYWLRLSAHLMLLPAILVLLKREHDLKYLKRGLVVVLGSLLLLGGVQLWLLPNLDVIGRGWDPHQGRLVATWLDPNLFGATLAMLGGWLLPQLNNGIRRQVIFVLVASAILGVVLTQSRSALLALLMVGSAGMALVLPYVGARLNKNLIRQISIISFSALLVVIILVVLIFGGRFYGLVNWDPTIEVRLAAWPLVWQMMTDNAWIGVGYNAYQYEALEVGLIGGFDIHSRAGADNSWATLWITTGLIGMALFLLPWLVLAQRMLERWVADKSSLALGALLAGLILFIHAQFVNSFLYSHLLVMLVLIVAVTLVEPLRKIR